jgi:dipeptidyl aminopeptidase/acylaminoacyl peptidase
MMKTLLAALLIGAAPVAAFAQGKPAENGRVATSVFAQLPFMTNPQLSPNGKMVAMQLSHEGSEHMAVLDLSVPNAKPTLIASAGEYKEIGDRTIDAWTWIGNDNVVMTLASREDAFGQRVDLTRLFAYNVRTRKITPLAWEGALGLASQILYIDHDKGEFLLQRQTNRYGTERWFRPEVVRVDVNTGKFETVVRANPAIGQWFSDGKGVIRAGTGYDSDSGKVQVIYRSGAKDSFDTIFNRADKDFTGSTIVPSIFLKEPDMAIVTSNDDGLRKVYKVNLKKMELGRPIFEAKGYDVGTVFSNPTDDDLIGVSVVEQGMRYHWTHPDWKTMQGFLDESFGRGNASIRSRSRDETRFIVEVGSPNQAGAYYLYDTNSGAFGRIGWRDNLLTDRRLNPVSTISYRASDGETIPAVLTMPRHRTGKNLPLVILTHGGPFGVRDAEDYDSWSQAMAELGYVVVQPNYRGSGGYGAEWIKKGRADGFGLRMQDDLNDAVTHLAGQGIVDPERVCMMGWSYGGYASARAAQRDADKYRCTIAGAGVYDLAMMKRYDANYLGSFGSNYLAKGAADLDTVSPAQNTKGRWAPIMIVHGLRDQRVPIEQARTLVSRLKGSGKVEGVDFDYVEQPKNTHNLPYSDVRMEWLEAAERWLAKHNPAYIPSDVDKPVPVTTTLQ